MKKITLILALFMSALVSTAQCPTSVTYSSSVFTFNYFGSTPSGTYNQLRVTISAGKGNGNSYLLAINSNSGTTIITDNASNAVDSTSVASKIEYYQSGSNAGLADCNTSTPLPVKLLNFKVEVKDEVAALQWSTASEIDNEKFIIERSNDGNTFTKIGEVQGNGNSEQIIIYGFIDDSPIYQNTYYRLKQIDYDGAFEYSPIIIAKPSSSSSSLALPLIFPNPCTNEITITGADNVELLGNTDSKADSYIKTFDTSQLSPGIHTIIIDNKAYKILKQ